MNIDTTRYDRQIALPQIDLHGQEQLNAAHIVIIGMGGLGCAAAQSLALMGVGHLSLIDHDTIERSNLARQALYNEKDVGKPKVQAATEALQTLNPSGQITPIEHTFDNNTLYSLVEVNPPISLVLDCTDNQTSRLAINSACYKANIPLITAAAIRFEGMICCVLPESDSPCYECLSKVWPDPNESCVERGIFGPVVSLIGHYQAMLAGQYILGLPILGSGKVHFFDGLHHTWRNLQFSKHSQCSTCSTKAV
jgi:adenylyltransferase/sulfurtransferase